MRKLLLVWLAVLCGCTGVPENVEPVKNFDLDRYLGRWYEIARLDHSFERGLTHVTADYSRNDDGSVKVINRGYSREEGEWQQADGRARFAGDPRTAHLEVSFFGPFYASYVIIALDDNYRHALVTGYNRDYLWLLSREPSVPDAELQPLLEQARDLGYPIDQLIFVEQDNRPPEPGR
ncbi:lipocalin family protein [Microbulbifer yueqingensis]|uniref:Outer membrane lipoprotein Blc n=1 Tax=Microbulbifer yueqingensis TaxID=658219 RepID=A0A1G9C0Z4_9GAMM|nr:lipocalin family protein [Microbulbifer yueqingensis]SDK45366.1 apolipoprotein D and lipocalin family protein [Microbulbifer yueqingensis]